MFTQPSYRQISQIPTSNYPLLPTRCKDRVGEHVPELHHHQRKGNGSARWRIQFPLFMLTKAIFPTPNPHPPTSKYPSCCKDRVGIRWGSASIGINRGNRMLLHFSCLFSDDDVVQAHAPPTFNQPLLPSGCKDRAGEHVPEPHHHQRKGNWSARWRIRFPLFMPIEAEPHRIPKSKGIKPALFCDWLPTDSESDGSDDQSTKHWGSLVGLCFIGHTKDCTK